MTLNEIEKKYKARMRLRASPMSYGEYLTNRSEDYNAAAAAKKTAVLTALGRGRAGYGTTAEQLEGQGLTQSGYAKYLSERNKGSAEAALADIEQDRLTAAAKAKQSYLGYIENYESKQSKLRESVVSALRRDRVLNPEQMYEYAASVGLSGKAAEGLYQSVYDSLRNTLRNEILAKVYSNEMTPLTAAAYAREIGLNSDDAADIERMAEKYLNSFSNYSEGYLDYLESLGNKNTVSYGG